MWGIITAEGQDSRKEKQKKKKKGKKGKKGENGGMVVFLKEGFLLHNLMSVCSRGHVEGPAAKPLAIERKKKHVVTHKERTSHYIHCGRDRATACFYLTASIRVKLLDFFPWDHWHEFKAGDCAGTYTCILLNNSHITYWHPNVYQMLLFESVICENSTLDFPKVILTAGSFEIILRFSCSVYLLSTATLV